MLLKLAALLAVVGTSWAQRPMNTSICDYYTTAVLKNNTADNQYQLLAVLVNTAVIGNYTQPNMNAVPGILAVGQKYNGTYVNLLQYFNGMLNSTNNGGDAGVSQSFLDGGGAAPLKMSKPAMDTTSNQYFLLTHLYQFFGVLLGCSQYGKMGFPTYAGMASMYEVHKFMALDPYQMGYFIQQVGLAATSLGVTADDAAAAGMALTKLFDYRCSPPTTVVQAQGPRLQSMCDDPSCPLDPMSQCGLEDNNGVALIPVNVTMNSTSSMMPNTSAPMGSATPAAFKGDAVKSGAATFAVIGAGLAYLLL